MSRVGYWTNKVEELRAERERATQMHEDEDVIVGIVLDLHEAEEQLNFAWQDDELEEMGLL